MKNINTVYLAGKITGDTCYFSKFYDAARKLEGAGYVVINPANLPPEGFTYDAYIRMSTAMMDECEAVFFLPDWVDSKGAMYEYGRAVAKGKEIILYDEWLTAQETVKEITGAFGVPAKVLQEAEKCTQGLKAAADKAAEIAFGEAVIHG